MKYIIAADTDVGITKTTNQDSLCMKAAQSRNGQSVLAVLCDGMGGLSKGELASATVVKLFAEWFETTFSQIEEVLDWEEIAIQWQMMITDLNTALLQYGAEHQVQLGTTISAILICQDEYLILHVGDSRIYKIQNKVDLLTEDQTVVARDVRNGLLTPEQAETDVRRNILLQCVGASPVVVPQMLRGTVEEGCAFLLCSDGFRHVISTDDMWYQLYPPYQTDSDVIRQNLRYLIELVKSRNEPDNITAAYIKAE